MKYVIKFLNPWCKVVYVTKEVKSQEHLDNYIKCMEAKMGYTCDEVWNAK